MGREGSTGACGRLLALLSLLALVVSGYHPAASAGAAPGPAVTPTRVRAAPDWMSSDTTAALDLGFDVLVPGWVPAPFSGEPRVAASAGYYSLYWMLPGEPPTFLEITGTVGGTIPDFSWYDRNNQLEQNADVQGYPAYHDLSPAYDLVYWQVGDVVYSVNSQNLAETDSLSLANALEVVTPAADSGGDGEPSDDGSGSDGGVADDGDEGAGGGSDGEDPPVEVLPPSLGLPDTVQSGEITAVNVEGVDGALLEADAGAFVETGDASYPGAAGFPIEWRPPETTGDLTVSFVVIDPTSGEWLASASTLVLGAPDDPPSVSMSLDCPVVVTGGNLAAMTVYGSGSLVLDVTHGSWPSQPPNTLFDPGADGGGTMVGSLPDGGTASLAWHVPDVAVPVTAYVYATDVNGETVECAVDVEPAADLPDPVQVGDTSIEDGTGDLVETTRPSEAESEPPVSELPLSRDGRRSATGLDTSAAGGLDSPTASLSSSGMTGGGTTGREEPAVGKSLQPDGGAETESRSEPSDDPSPGVPVTPTIVPDAVPDRPQTASAPAPTTAPLPIYPPTAVAGPRATTAGEVAAIIGPEGGTLTSPAGATLSVPPGVFNSPANVRISPIPDSWLPVAGDVELVPETVFDITVTAVRGGSVLKLTRPVELSLVLKAGEQSPSTRIYWVNEERLEPLTGSLLRSDTVAAPLDHFSRFVAGAPVDDGRTFLPWIVSGLGLLALLAVAGVASNAWHPRPRSASRRISSPRRGVR